MKMTQNASIPTMNSDLSPNLRISLARKNIEKIPEQTLTAPNTYPMVMGVNPKPPSSIGMVMNRGKREADMTFMNERAT